MESTYLQLKAQISKLEEELEEKKEIIYTLSSDLRDAYNEINNLKEQLNTIDNLLDL